jgi:hypothetical protein
MSDPTVSYYGGGTGGTGDYSAWNGNAGAAGIWDPFNIFHKNPTQVITGSKYTPEQSGLLQMLSNYMSQYAGGQQLPSYTGELTAPTNATQLGGLSNLQTAMAPNNPITQTTNQSLQDIIGGKTALPEALTANYKANIEDPLLKTYKEQIMPELAGTMASKGLSYGSTKQKTAEDLTNNLTDSLSKGRAQLGADITNSTIQNQLGGINAANSGNQTTLAQILGMENIGNTEQTTQQNSDTAQMNQWLRNQPGSNPALQMIMQILGLSPNYAPTVPSTSNDSGGLMSLVSSII